MYADFLTCIERISENPSIGDALKGSWKGFSSFHFHRKPEMRIIYALYSCCKPIEMEEKESENWDCRFEEKVV